MAGCSGDWNIPPLLSWTTLAITSEQKTSYQSLTGKSNLYLVINWLHTQSFLCRYMYLQKDISHLYWEMVPTVLWSLPLLQGMSSRMLCPFGASNQIQVRPKDRQHALLCSQNSRSPCPHFTQRWKPQNLLSMQSNLDSSPRQASTCSS